MAAASFGAAAARLKASSTRLIACSHGSLRASSPTCAEKREPTRTGSLLEQRTRGWIAPTGIFRWLGRLRVPCGRVSLFVGPADSLVMQEIEIADHVQHDF